MANKKQIKNKTRIRRKQGDRVVSMVGGGFTYGES